MSLRVPFNALTPGEDAAAVRAAIDRVIASGWFVLGPEVEAFEAEFAAASRVPHAVGVGTGTDAITLILRALDIGPGDEVITPPLSAAYSALAVMMAGARPVFADIDPERLTMDPRAAEAAITPRTQGACYQCISTDRPRTCGRSKRSRRNTGSRWWRMRRSRTWARQTAGRLARLASRPPPASIQPKISARSATAARC